MERLGRQRGPHPAGGGGGCERQTRLAARELWAWVDFCGSRAARWAHRAVVVFSSHRTAPACFRFPVPSPTHGTTARSRTPVSCDLSRVGHSTGVGSVGSVPRCPTGLFLSGCSLRGPASRRSASQHRPAQRLAHTCDSRFSLRHVVFLLANRACSSTVSELAAFSSSIHKMTHPLNDSFCSVGI